MQQKFKRLVEMEMSNTTLTSKGRGQIWYVLRQASLCTFFGVVKGLLKWG